MTDPSARADAPKGPEDAEPPPGRPTQNPEGMDRPTFVLGFPDWVFWGILAPWSACVVFSFWFGATFMRDEDLGEELPEQEDELGLGGG